jgi:hypothetical protein
MELALSDSCGGQEGIHRRDTETQRKTRNQKSKPESAEGAESAEECPLRLDCYGGGQALSDEWNAGQQQAAVLALDAGEQGEGGVGEADQSGGGK